MNLASADATLTETLLTLETRRIASRRRVLQRLGVAALAAQALETWAAACTLIPSETPGPFPGDGTIGPNVLAESGILRSDIRASFGSAGNAVATGVPLTFTLQLVDVDDNCAPLAGHAVYVWHCDASGRYSLYSPGATTQNYLRGVQVSDASGRVTFRTIYPGCYPGRWPHIHFEVYAKGARADRGDNAVRTSQLALTEAASREVYAQAAMYPGSLAALSRITLRSDGVFADDGGVHQLASVTGNVASGYSAHLQVGIRRRGA